MESRGSGGQPTIWSLDRDAVASRKESRAGLAQGLGAEWDTPGGRRLARVEGGTP